MIAFASLLQIPYYIIIIWHKISSILNNIKTDHAFWSATLRIVRESSGWGHQIIVRDHRIAQLSHHKLDNKTFQKESSQIASR